MIVNMCLIRGAITKCEKKKKDKNNKEIKLVDRETDVWMDEKK